jgi:multidrug efflux pump subunit AcrA (membrane-fusion protein)
MTMLAQTSTPAKSKAKTPTISASDVQQLKDALAAQQKQIEQLKQQLAQSNQNWQQTQQQLQQAQAAAADAQAKAQQATAQAGQQQQSVTDLRNQVTDLKQNATNAALSLQETQKSLQASMENPTALHYKGITLTPGGYLAADTVYRSHALGAEMPTPFNSIPFSGSSTAQMSEFFATGRQSRLSMLAEGKLNSATLNGYVEADFNSAGITSNNNSTNSYTLRIRQAFGQAALNSGWSFTGGQMWSLVTETKNGVDNRTEAVPLTIDTQYNVGFSYARQYGFRVAKNFSNKFWLAASVEEAQTTLGGRGASNNFLIGQQGNSSGAYNPTQNYSYNRTPDFVIKTVFQPGWGHYEVFGLISDFRDRIFPCATTTTGTCGGTKAPNAVGAFNNTEFGGGLGINARGTIAKHVDIGLHLLGGNGIGRYGAAGLPDIFARPDGVLKPLREFQGLGTIEWHSKRLDIYGNGGAEYAGRHWYQSGKEQVGYGAPGNSLSGCTIETPPAATTVTVVTPPTTTGGETGTTNIPVPGSAGTPLTGGFNPGSLSKCSADTRAVIEGTVGFWYRIYSGPKGRIQVGPQYSYVVRNAWLGTGGDASANENMFFTSFRYFLP